jgi:signal transduction histidine kinase
MVGLRLYVAPVVASLAIWLGLWEASAWRRTTLLALATGIITLTIAEAIRYRRRGMVARAADLNLGVAIVGQLTVSAATGGLESPFLPLVLLLAMFASMQMAERPWYYWLFVGLQLLAPWLFGAVAVLGAVDSWNLELLGGGRRAGHGDLHLWLSASFLSLGTLVAIALGRTLRSIFDMMLWRALEANEALRREHGERSRELVTLSGEIAHELKNPMASIKGLAALLAQGLGEGGLGEGKAAERLGVLRHEVDRMQTILEEFLNFSRPLVPLALERAELLGLCEEVAALHEGLARERGVRLMVTGARAAVRCDPRKVQQTLVNLVQNALDATPAGKVVELHCQRVGGQAIVLVLDQGPGVEPAIASHLFEPGTTTKAKGTGLGLTIARALARQHGGELTLGKRDGGGARAELVLPAEPPLPEGAEPVEVSV